MTEQAQHILLRNQNLWLMPQKAVFWQDKRLLLVADLHLGKAGHFRNQGIPVPGRVNKTNLDILSELIFETSASHLVILGDLFHSKINEEWDQFQSWRSAYPDLEISLIKGNHDILSPEYYKSAHIKLYEQWLNPPFLMVHDSQKLTKEKLKNNFTLSGHIHPAVRLTGKGRQSIKLPCFYFGKNQGMLPAIGTFTGTCVIEPKTSDRIFAIANRQIIAF